MRVLSTSEVENVSGGCCWFRCVPKVTWCAPKPTTCTPKPSTCAPAPAPTPAPAPPLR